MDPSFIATLSNEALTAALNIWPELASRRVRPLLVTAFGAIYVETDDGDVWVANPIEIECSRVAASVEELQGLFTDQEWAGERLMVNLALLAKVGHTPSTAPGIRLAPHPTTRGG